MTSELEFVRDYTSFWRTISPLSEDFVKRINLSVLKRFDAEISSRGATSRRGLINEVAFELFAYYQSSKISLENLTKNDLEKITDKVSNYISHLRAGAPDFSSILSEEEVAETMEIAKKLISFFGKFKTLEIHPKLAGCGKISACYGDVIADDILYEVKSGGRHFRSVDLRQLVLYMALNRAKKQYQINRLGLYNPRCGFHFLQPCNEFSLQFSGLTAEELCHKIIYELGSTDVGDFEQSN
jgi:hypothetical protein